MSLGSGARGGVEATSHQNSKANPLSERTVVTILAGECDETFEIPPELEAELLKSIAEADRSETLSADELLRRLRQIPEAARHANAPHPAENAGSLTLSRPVSTCPATRRR